MPQRTQEVREASVDGIIRNDKSCKLPNLDQIDKSQCANFKEAWEKEPLSMARSVEVIAQKNRMSPLKILELAGIKLTPNFKGPSPSNEKVDLKMKNDLWKSFIENGRIPPYDNEINIAAEGIEETERFSISYELERNILKYRESFFIEEHLIDTKGLHIKEYIYDQQLLGSLAKELGKSKEQVHEMVLKVFDKKFPNGYSGDDRIKINEMLKLLKAMK